LLQYECMFSQDEVKHIAKLVKLDVTDQEEILSEMFSQTLDYIKVLDELQTQDLPETYQVIGTKNVFQTQEHPCNTLDQKEALKNASETSQGLFVTKGVLNK